MNLGKINRQSIGISSFTSVLSHIPKPPKELYVAGELPTARRPTVAIVGSRKPTAYGEEVTHRLATDLAKAGIVIVSGLAFGVDAIAHKAALDAGGTTIAVLAGGLHAVYPVAHRDLAAQIINNGGALISEQAMGVDVHKYHFLARNRLVSGLADALIITEATERSGTLSTVAYALEQNKEIFAVPGPITSLLSAGPNRLLQQGAHVALSARDILEVIAPELLSNMLNPPDSQTTLSLGFSELEADIIRFIREGIRNTDKLHTHCNVPIQELLRALTALELNGTIKAIGAEQWRLA